MADNINITRPASESEKADFVELGSDNILNAFQAKLAEKQLEYQKKYIPFDRYTARIEFDDYIRQTVGDAMTTVDRSKASKKIKLPNFDEYAESNRFEYLGSDEVREDKLLDGMRQSAVTGKRFDFKGKSKGNRISIFVPSKDVDDVEKRVAKDYSKK